MQIAQELKKRHSVQLANYFAQRPPLDVEAEAGSG